MGRGDVKMRRIVFLAVAIMTIWNAALATANAYMPEGKFIRYDEAGLNRLRQAAKSEAVESVLVKSLGSHANWQMKQPIQFVAEKTGSADFFANGGTKNDYASLSIYYWPDASTPFGLPYVYKDGLINPERADLSRYDAIRLEKMVSAVATLSTAYYVTRQEEYAQRAVLWLRTWFVYPMSRMNPHLNFAQSVPGKAAGTPAGIIETVGFIEIIDATMMLEDYPGWTEEDKDALRHWFKAYLRWLADSPLGIREKAANNNHGVWYDAQIAAYAYYIGDTDLLRSVIGKNAYARIHKQIRPTGEMPLEMSRTRSLHYVLYNLRAFVTLARLAEKVGVNLWDYETEDGRGIKKALDYAVPYVLGEKEWQRHSVVPEKEHAAAVYLAMAGNHFRSERYLSAAVTLLGDPAGFQAVAVRSFSRSFPGGR